jgi:hypothetical protein
MCGLLQSLFGDILRANPVFFGGVRPFYGRGKDDNKDE